MLQTDVLKKHLSFWRILLSQLVHMSFWGILRQVSQQQLPRKTPLIFGILSIILSICCCHLLNYYLTKFLWNCIIANQICYYRCCSLSLFLPVWLNMSRILICRFHMTKAAESENSVLLFVNFKFPNVELVTQKCKNISLTFELLFQKEI